MSRGIMSGRERERDNACGNQLLCRNMLYVHLPIFIIH